MSPIRVPTVKRGIADQPLPAVRVEAATSAADFGALEAEVVGQLGRQITQVGQIAQTAQAREEQRQAKFKDRDDKLKANEAFNKLNDSFRKYKLEPLSKIGVDTRGITDKGDIDIAKIMKKAEDGLDNDEQRNLFRAKSASKREILLGQLQGHESTEFRKAEVAAIDSSIENGIRDAAEVTATLTGSERDLALSDIREFLKDDLEEKTQGMMPAQAKNVRNEVVSAFHESVLNEMVAVNAGEAQAYYNKNKKEVIPENREAVENLINKEDVLQFGQDKASEIALRESDRSLWVATARIEIKDEAKRKATIKELETRKKELDQHDSDKKQEAYEGALRYIINDATDLSDAINKANTLDDPIQQQKALKISEERFEIKKRATVTDRDVQAIIFGKIDSGEITRVDQLLEFTADLSDGDYDKLITAVRNKAAKDKGAKVPEINYTTAKRAFEIAKSEGYDVDNETHTREFMFLLQELDGMSREKGVSLIQVEANKAVNTLIIQEGEAIGANIFYDPDLTYFEAFSKDLLDIWLPDVNDESNDGGREFQDIKKAFLNRGYNTDDETLFRLYKKDAILNLELSAQQRKLCIEKIGQLKRIGGGRLRDFPPTFQFNR